jgi:hypothetical protein
MDPSGVEYIYTDTSTCTYSPCEDNSEPVSDTDSNGEFVYCDEDPSIYTDLASMPDFLLTSGDTDYVPELCDASQTAEFENQWGITQAYGRQQAYWRLRRFNGPKWRHIRNLYHQSQAQEATQELLDWAKKHPVLQSGGS